MNAEITEPAQRSRGSRTPPIGQRVGVPWRSLVRAALASAWTGVIPALLAAIAVRYGLRPVILPGQDRASMAARWLFAQPALVGVALFFVFAAMIRYWLRSLPGGQAQWASAPRPMPSSKSATASSVPGGGRRSEAASQDVAHRRAEKITLAVAMAAAAALALVLRAGVAESYTVLSASMVPTLEPGDRVLGSRMAYMRRGRPRRGDLVVFRTRSIEGGVPNAPDLLVKRVIGLPGDHIDMRFGAVEINGWRVPSCDVGPYLYVFPDGQGGGVVGRLLVEFLEDSAYLTVHSPPRPSLTDFAYDVNPGEFFVLGDNRNNSIDSRAYDHGRGAGVPASGIEARVQWFLLGTHRDGSVDTARFGRSIRQLSTRLHVEGVDVNALDQGIARCLKDWPKETHPPARAVAAAAASRQ